MRSFGLQCCVAPNPNSVVMVVIAGTAMRGAVGDFDLTERDIGRRARSGRP
jgi:hypothetical protein